MTTQEYLRELLARAIPDDGVIREEVQFVVAEISTHRVVVVSAEHPEVRFELEIRQPADRPYALMPLEDRHRTTTLTLTRDDIASWHVE